MKNRVFILLLALTLCLVGCEKAPGEETLPSVTETVPTTAVPTTVPPETTVPPTTVPPETTEPVGFSPETIDFSMKVPERFVTFIYDPEDTWLTEFLGEYVSDIDCKAGSYYSLDKRDKVIRLLWSGTVKESQETPNAIFCVTEDDQVLLLDYLGTYCQTIYTSAGGELKHCSRYNSWMSLIEDNKIVVLDLKTWESTVVLEPERVWRALMYREDQIFWQEGTNKWYHLDLKTNTNVPISEYEVERKMNEIVE